MSTYGAVQFIIAPLGSIRILATVRVILATVRVILVTANAGVLSVGTMSPRRKRMTSPGSNSLAGGAAH